MTNNPTKNYYSRVVNGVHHILYEISAEIMTVLMDEKLFHDLFRNVDSYEDRLIESLSHTRSETERTKIALTVMQDLWRTQMDSGPYLVPGLLADFECERLFYPKYRDHTVHQLRVLLLGLYLYIQNSVIRDAIRNELSHIQGQEDNNDLDRLFAHIWLVIAVYHDQGYVFECANRIDDCDRLLIRVFNQFNNFFEAPLHQYLSDIFLVKLPENRERRARAGLRLPQTFHISSVDDLLLDPDGKTCILDRIENLIDSCDLGPKGKSLRLYFEMARNETPRGAGHRPYYDHGITSAIMLLRSHEELRRYVNDFVVCDKNGSLCNYIPGDEARQIIHVLGNALDNSTGLIEHAAGAIALHNIDKFLWTENIYAGQRYELTLETFNISLTRMPLAFLLFLCDTLQDWDRPRFMIPISDDDYIRIDQHMLITANNSEVALRFYDSKSNDLTNTNDIDGETFAKVKSHLSLYLGNTIESLLSQNTSITKPDKLSKDSESQLKDLERLSLQRKSEVLEEQWLLYRSTIASDSYQLGEEQQRSRRWRHFAQFLEWCEKQGFDYVRSSPHKAIQRIYSFIQAELNDLNFVIEGSVIQGQKVISKIGAGGYGTVLKVQRDGESEDYYQALKVFHTNNFVEPELVDRFRRGFNSMKTLSHPQITKVSEFLLIPRGYFMEYIDGDNLAKFLYDRNSRNYLTTAQSRLELLIDICRILEYAHSEMVRHRDIKPENIIMRWSDSKGCFEPVLTDFDLAWYAQAVAITVSKTEFGSIYYAAPEQKRTKEDKELVHKPTIDVFSLGRLMYFIFTETPPEEDIDLGDHLYTVVQKRFRDVTCVSFAHQLAIIYKEATHVQPQERYQTITELKAQLTEVLRLLGVEKGYLEMKNFFFELALRLNPIEDNIQARQEAIKSAEYAEEGRLVVPMHMGSIEVDTKEPKDGKPYLDIRIEINSDKALAAMQQKSYKSARDAINLRIEKILHMQCPESYSHGKGKSGDFYSYGFRIPMPVLTLSALDKLEDTIKGLKYGIIK